MLLSAILFLFQTSLPAQEPAQMPAFQASPSQLSASQPLAITSTRPNSVEAGRALAVENCMSCHAIGRRGASPNPAAPRFRYLSRKYPIDNLSESFAEGIFIGHSVMPEFEFTADKVEALMAYIKSIQTPPVRQRKN